MATQSAIEWTEVTWNPVTDCDHVAAGCDNCYALALAKRLKAMGATNIRTTVIRLPPVRASMSRSIRSRWANHTIGPDHAWSS